MAEKIGEAKRQLTEIDLIVCNPPRKGLQPQALEAMLTAKAPKIIYVSCDPVTLARDLDRLTGNGYLLAGLQPLDMFPLTEEVETIALLERR